MADSRLIYAIDFGTSNSLLAAADGTRVYPPIPLDPLATDPTILRSLLFFPSQKFCFYGQAAIQEFLERQGEGRLIRSIKKHLPIRSFIGTWIEDRPANLEDLIGFFLGEMRNRANEHFQTDVKRAVLGRPARFAADDLDDGFAQFRLEQAAKKAGFEEIEFCVEPLAAAYEYRASLTSDKLVLVADFGGGTSDFTVIRLGPEAARSPRLDVLSIGGINLAGDALDGAVMRRQLAPFFGSELAYRVPFGSNVLKVPGHLIDKICSPADVSLLGKRDTREFLRNVQKWLPDDKARAVLDRLFCLVDEQLGFPVFEAIEASKRRLSEDDTTRIRFPHPVVDIDVPITRAQFDSFISECCRRIMETLDETLRQAGVRPDQIDVICLTGGTAKVPALREGLTARFGAEKLDTHNRFHSVVSGLAGRAREIA